MTTKNTIIGVRVAEEEKQQAIKKSGILSLSAVMRRLLQMWLNGEIELRISDLE